MPISSSSLFHYTSNGLKGLKSILKNGFEISLCTETKINYLENGITEIEKLAIPMLCFCDIPLSLIGNHSTIYRSKTEGVFSIGMTKKWGIDNGLNPIIYIPNRTNSAWNLERLPFIFGRVHEVNNFLKFIEEKLFEKGIEIEINQGLTFTDVIEAGKILIDGLSFVGVFKIGENMLYQPFPYINLFYKPYMQTYFRGENEIPNYVFYNEREWRYVPGTVNPIHIQFEPDSRIDQYARENKLDTEELYRISNDFFKSSSPNHKYENLSFQPKDVTFIIVSDNEAIPKLIDFIYDEMEIDVSAKKLYISKIISFETITNDIFSN